MTLLVIYIFCAYCQLVIGGHHASAAANLQQFCKEIQGSLWWQRQRRDELGAFWQQVI